MNNLFNQTPYLRTSRKFPEDIQQLSIELNKGYIDIVNAVNSRTIGLFPTTNPALTGEAWYISPKKIQETFRRVYIFISAGNIAHGINFANTSGFTAIYGTFTNGTNWYPLPYVDVVAVTNQISLYVTPTNIVITAGAGAPSIVSGYVVLEWLSFI